jgi:hypothetical protein
MTLEPARCWIFACDACGNPLPDFLGDVETARPFLRRSDAFDAARLAGWKFYGNYALCHGCAERYVPMSRACAMTGIARHALYRRMQRGSLPCLKLGGRVFFDVEDLRLLEPRQRRGDPSVLPRYPVEPIRQIVGQMALNLGSERAVMLSLAASSTLTAKTWERAWERAKASGGFTLRQADRFAHALNRDVRTLWPEAA